MSESLLFAILGFLTACLIGTVFASFLWRRAVAVTTRRITEDENFASLDQVANLRADLQSSRDLAAAKISEIEQAEARIADLEAALVKAESLPRGDGGRLEAGSENCHGRLKDGRTGERCGESSARNPKYGNQSFSQRKRYGTSYSKGTGHLSGKRHPESCS